MLLDSVEGLRTLHEDFAKFILSEAPQESFPAATDGSPAPYPEFLLGLRVRRSSHGSTLCISQDRWLELSASLVDLQRFSACLLVPKDGDHRHWHGSPTSLIIEADDWRAHES
jgi:hypothetical protein